MKNSKYFTSIDLFIEYWQCCIADKDVLKIAFLMRYGLYKWVVMPMGLTNTPAMFMQTMNNLFFNTLDSSMLVFLDSILVYWCTVKEHFMLLKKVLACLYQYMFYCKLKKFNFLHNSTTFIGFRITPEGICISDSKVQNLNKWTLPTIVK